MDVDKDNSFMDCEMDWDVEDEAVTVVSQSSCNNMEKRKTHKRKKLRRLMTTGNNTDKRRTNSIKKCKRFLIITFVITFTLALLMGHYLTQTNSNTKKILKEFLKNYRSQYRSIVHGKNNYCDQKVDTSTLFARIKNQQILHQDEAIKKIEIALRNESDLNAIALIGPVGVGKTLFIRALQNNFPWPENVHTYAWNTYVNDEAEKFHLIRILIQNLSDCGQNLVVIDNLRACDNGVVAIINQLLVDSIKKQHKRVIVFYVFNLNAMLIAEPYAMEENLLQDLPDCEIVNFKAFTQNELKDCIRHEAEVENVFLSKESFDDIVNTIDPLQSGCKNVNAKVLMYATIKSKDFN